MFVFAGQRGPNKQQNMGFVCKFIHSPRLSGLKEGSRSLVVEASRDDAAVKGTASSSVTFGARCHK